MCKRPNPRKLLRSGSDLTKIAGTGLNPSKSYNSGLEALEIEKNCEFDPDEYIAPAWARVAAPGGPVPVVIPVFTRGGG